MSRLLSLLLLATFGCAATEPEPFTVVAVTFNTGTTEGLRHDPESSDGYGSEQAALSDMYYGDGLAWRPVVEATRAFFAEVQPDVVGFQEVFHSPECAAIPTEAHAGFVCEAWSAGDPTVANVVLGMGYQVACHLGKPDKCAAVRRDFGTFRGCDEDYCLEGLGGVRVPDCGSGGRVGRAVIDLVDGGELTLVNVHGSSGLTPDDITCRVAQVRQIFEDLDGAPAANGQRNIILGDFNTDPLRFIDADASARLILENVGEGLRFDFITDVGWDTPGSYGDLADIDHVITDSFEGECWVAGQTEGHPAVYGGVYFDHRPVVCTLVER